MFKEALGTASPPKQKFDYLIAGSGAAGTTFAMEKLRAGASVLILESGTFDGLREDFLSHRSRTCDGFHNGTDSEGPANPWTLRVLGGGMTRYAGIMLRYRTKDFHRSGDFPDATLNPDWPICYEELEPHYDWVERRIGIARADTGDATNPGSMPPVMPPHPSSSRAKFLNEAFSRRDVPHFPTPLGINSVPYQGRPACTSCGYCNEEFCPIGAKSNPFHVIGNMKAELDNLTVITDRHVVKITTAPGSNRLTGVECRSSDGQTHHYFGDKIVIAAGALQSSSILLRSRPHGSSTSPGDHAGLLGRGVQFKLTGYSSVDVGPRLEHDPVSLFTTSATTHFYEQVGDSKPGGFVYEAASRDNPGQLRVHFVVPEAPRVENRVSVVPGSPAENNFRLTITHRPSDADTRRRDALRKQVESLLCEVNQKVSTCLETNSVGLAHLAGGCRSGADPNEAVTDPAGRVYGFENLVVADSSTFPYAAAINPTMTLMANARRLALLN